MISSIYLPLRLQYYFNFFFVKLINEAVVWELVKCDFRADCVPGCSQNRQMKSDKSAADVERLKPLNGSTDSYSVNLSATNDDVNLQWHQQQRQQLVM